MTPSTSAAEPKAVQRADYQVPAHMIESVDLDIDLYDEATVVTSRLNGRRNPESGSGAAPLVLFGVDLDLVSLVLNDNALSASDYTIEGEDLTIPGVGGDFILDVVTRIKPAENSSLEGLYLSGGMSGGMYCTQCEAEGFRKITYFPDRPDVMAIYRTTIRADKAGYPVLLSNGNPIEAGELADGRHYATWHDPFPKPSYLFAMVAGDLAFVEDSHTTSSGREVTLRIFVEHGEEKRCGHAMRSLKKSMAWDEEVYGLEYDLDLFMIVAVSHFNMGAMENKGLNIFNSRYVLADEDSATDLDFQRIEAIVAHEYFHNWTGNRVTCQDWFQLTLKEGLTVFRDQQFSADMHSAAVKRIEDARVLRAVQFPEDGGPMAHPIRPESYMEINNFYTVTVYEKGAEVIRMIHTMLGQDGFRRGMDLYFERHDGKAATCEDFVVAMEDANGADLKQLRRWYEQAGTPELEVSLSHDPEARTATLNVRQSTSATPGPVTQGQATKDPFDIPLSVGLLAPDGSELPLRLEGALDNETPTTRVLRMDGAEKSFTFTGVDERPVASLLRNFSAPVNLKTDYSDDDLAFLMAKDTDAFSRWDAGQTLAQRCLLNVVAAGGGRQVDGRLVEAIAATLRDETVDPSFKAEALALPSETVLAQAMEVADPDAIHAARSGARQLIGEALFDDLHGAYEQAEAANSPRDMDTDAMASRSLANMCLSYLVASGREEGRQLAKAQADQGTDEGGSMSNAMGALSALNNTDCAERTAALSDFHDRWRDDPLVLDKWFSLNAMSAIPGTLDEVKRLMDHPDFDMGNPNRVRALIGAFSGGNPVTFHAVDGSGYAFLCDRVLELDPSNSQVAARLLGPLTRWRRYDQRRQALMTTQLKRIAGTAKLSRDVYEIANKGLK